MNRILARVGRVRLAVAGAVITAAVLLLVGSALTLGTMNQLASLFLLMTLASAWNLVGGFGGQFSLGHSIFVGIGAYATAVILTHFSLPLPLIVLASGLASSVIGVILAYPLLRLRGPYLAVGSLGMGLAAYGWMINWNFTHASSSFPIPTPGLLGLHAVYVWSVGLAAFAVVVVVVTVNSPLGLRLIALREDETGAASLGVRRVRTLIPVWAISGLLTGLMGAVFGLQQGNLSVDLVFTTQLSLDAAIICVIGGLGTITGPLIGAVVIYYLRYYAADYSNLAMLIEAAVLILVVRFFPGGVVGLASRFGLAARARRSTSATVGATVRTPERVA